MEEVEEGGRFFSFEPPAPPMADAVCLRLPEPRVLLVFPAPASLDAASAVTESACRRRKEEQLLKEQQRAGRGDDADAAAEAMLAVAVFDAGDGGGGGRLVREGEGRIVAPLREAASCCCCIVCNSLRGFWAKRARRDPARKIKVFLDGEREKRERRAMR